MDFKNQVVFGRKPVLDAIHQGLEVDKVLIVQSLRGEFEVELRKLSKDHGFTLQRVPQEKLNYLSKNETHQGVVAYLSPIKYASLSVRLSELLSSNPNPVLLVMDGIEDVRNFGAIGRSALAFGVDIIVTFSKGNARVNDVAVKTSAGALLKIPVCKEENISETLTFLGKSGIKIIASSLKSENHLENLDTSGPVAIVLGSEEKGISRITQDYADETFKINQSEQMESLNVSVAAGIILHHVFKNRK